MKAAALILFMAAFGVTLGAAAIDNVWVLGGSIFAALLALIAMQD